MSGVTVSQSQNITSPDGNSLAVYKQEPNGQYIVKDIYGQEEFLLLHQYLKFHQQMEEYLFGFLFQLLLQIM